MTSLAETTNTSSDAVTSTTNHSNDNNNNNINEYDREQPRRSLGGGSLSRMMSFQRNKRVPSKSLDEEEEEDNEGDAIGAAGAGTYNQHSSNSSRNRNSNLTRSASVYHSPKEIPDFVEQDISMKDFLSIILNNGTADNVACFKMLVFLILIMSFMVIGNAAFVFTSQELNDDYLTEFDSYATDIIAVTQDRINTLFDFTISLKDHLVGQCVETQNCTWPFVTFTAFEERHHLFNLETYSDEVALIPLVSQVQRSEWEEYSVAQQAWVQEGIDYRRNLYTNTDHTDRDVSPKAAPITPYLHNGAFNVNDKFPAPVRPVYAPFWQISPASLNPVKVNYDAFQDKTFQVAFDWMEATRHPFMSEVVIGAPIVTTNEHDGHILDKIGEGLQEPHFWLLEPLGESFDEESQLVGIFATLVTWSRVFLTSIPVNRDEITLVLHDSCGEKDYTFSIFGQSVLYLGIGDLHDLNYNDLVVHGDLPSTTAFYNEDLKNISSKYETPCKYSISIYPTEEFRKSFSSNDPLIYTSVVWVIMLSTIGIFCLYDRCVEQRQDKLATTAAKSNALVSSLFPEQVKEQLLKDEDGKAGTTSNPIKSLGGGYLTANNNQPGPEDPIRPKFLASKPIAELFPETTILFADIVGFSAWSSAREPAQVFTLLEAIYNNFDVTAHKRGIFKVETIGDSYVAGAGLPEPRKDHAVAMARFAYTIIRIMRTTVQSLQISLGPDTEDLTLRIGLHSGPVTGGVLRGEKSRFQLFGDTMNTAARMESNGQSGMVHMSADTAELLKKANRGNWVKPREDLINAKGKGRLQTYWLDFKVEPGRRTSISSDADEERSDSKASEKSPESDSTTGNDAIMKASTQTEVKLDKRSQRVVYWLVDMLLKYLKQIVAMRDQKQHERTERRVSQAQVRVGGTVLDEVQEIIALPTIAANYKRDPASVTIAPEVEAQLVDFVSRIANMYRQNEFHNFEHAGHVTMSVAKLLSRIVSPHDIDYSEMTYKQKKSHAKLHQQTYGITSDPLTQFAIIFSALIHDVDHPGVPNAQLVKEGGQLAELYKGKSVAEQNSVDLSWYLLLSSNYSDLLRCICASREERLRFRQLVVNAVMATDIVDKELGALRKQRWEKAFNSDNTSLEENPRDHINRKATIVIEHLIQASDVAHTMQHWHVYQKWNKKFFKECYKAYKEGRAEKDPSEGWYQGEIGFFDYYIIPLTNKLKECGVFGVSSDEYLNYALANREEWEKKGEAIVRQYIAEYDHS